MDFYFDCYAELGLQRFMVADQARTDAFAAALKEVVKKGDRVIDAGTGSGLLALLAAKAGAEKVYALEQSRIADAAKQSVEKNGLGDVVEVLNTNAVDFQLAEPVDLIVSEWLGHFGFAEAMLDDVLDCRVANLKEGGVMMPSAVRLFLAPVSSTLLYDEEGPGFWRNPIHGLDFSHLETLELEQALAIKTIVPPEDVICPGQTIVDLDLATTDKQALWTSGTLSFKIKEDGCLDGFAGWFDAQLSPSVILDTSPQCVPTHWQQSFFPLPSTPLSAGQTLTISYSLQKHPVEPRSLLLEIGLGEQLFSFTIG